MALFNYSSRFGIFCRTSWVLVVIEVTVLDASLLAENIDLVLRYYGTVFGSDGGRVLLFGRAARVFQIDTQGFF